METKELIKQQHFLILTAKLHGLNILRLENMVKSFIQAFTCVRLCDKFHTNTSVLLINWLKFML